ncbi:hypothetical protein Tco_0491129 [Tanacetum coccineum]
MLGSFFRALHPKWKAKVTAIEELKDVSSPVLDELIGKSCDDRNSTSESDDEKYAMAVRNLKKFFRRKGRFVRQTREEKKSFRQRDDKKDKRDRKCFRCADSENKAEYKINEETCLMAQSSNEVTLDSSHFSDNASSFDDDMEREVGRPLIALSIIFTLQRLAERTKYVGPSKVFAKVGAVAYKLELLQELSMVHNTFHGTVETMDREVKRLRQSRVPIVKVRWNSRRGPEFTWEREDQFRKKYLHLFTKTARSSKSSKSNKIWEIVSLIKKMRLEAFKTSMSISSVKTPMVLPNNLGPDLASKPVNKILYSGMISDIHKLPREFWCTAIAYDPNPPANDSKLTSMADFQALLGDDDLKEDIKEDPALNKKVLEATEAYTKNSTTLTELLTLMKTFDLSGLKSLTESLKVVVDAQNDHLAKWTKSSTSIPWSLALGRHLEEIHVTWAQFWKKPDKIANWHNEGLKNCSQKVETASGFIATPSGIASDGIKTLSMASERSQPKENIEDSASQDNEDYSTCARIPLKSMKSVTKLRNDEIQAHLDKEEKIKKAVNEAKKRYERLKKILRELGIQSALPLPAPEQGSSQLSGRKRRRMELEPEIHIPALVCNMSLPERVLIVNNMVIKEPEYGMFFINVFGDEDF